MNELFYDGSPALSYNPYVLATLGGRGVGKTYWWKKRVLTKPGQTVWIRRYDADVDELCGGKKGGDRFTPDLFQTGVLNEDTETYIEDRVLYIDDFPKVYFVALNTSSRKKSASYAGVSQIVFDEFLEIDQGKYLKNETTKFYELVETVGRLRLKEFGQKDIRITMIANKVSFMNPYFADWGITPFTGRFKWFKDNTVLVENYRNEKFEQKKAQSNFGKLVAGTRYADYAIYNKSWDNDDAYLEKVPKDAFFECNVRYKDKNIGIWTWGNLMYCSHKTNTDTRLKYADTYECLDDELPLRRSKPPISWLQNFYESGLLRFDDNIIKQYVFTIMQTGGTNR